MCFGSLSSAPLKNESAHASFRGMTFFKGVLLRDSKHILQKIVQAQAGRWIKFTSLKEITAMQSILRDYIHEALEVEELGKKVPLRKDSEYVVPEELQVRLNAAPELKAAFEALTLGTRKSYIFHVSGAKQAKTQEARTEKCVPMILRRQTHKRAGLNTQIQMQSIRQQSQQN